MTLTDADTVPITDAQAIALREWAQGTADSPTSPWADDGQDDEEELYDCPTHGVVTGPDCPRCA